MVGKKIILILNIIFQIFSLYNITLTTTGMENSKYYKILYTKYIGRPIDIVIHDDIPNVYYDIKYKNNKFLYIRSNSDKIKITLIWDDSIGEGDNIYFTTDLSLIDETTYDINSDEDLLESDTYFFTDNQRKLEEIFNSQESDSTTEQNSDDIFSSENSKFESTYAEFIDQKNITLNAENMFKDCKVIETIDFIDFDISRI